MGKVWTAVKDNANGLSALIALLALLGIGLQIDAASNLQALQSARDAYRSHLVLSMERPHLAQPEDACRLMAGEDATAYDAFVAHLLYAGEQMLEQRPDWATLFERELEPHLAYLCAYRTEFLTEGEMDRLLVRMTDTRCATVPRCG